MLVNLLSSSELKKQFDVSFSYRASPRYTSELHARMAVDFPVYPLAFRDPSDLFVQHGVSRSPLQRIGRALSRQLLTVPLLIWETLRLRALLLRLRPDVLHINNGGFPGALSARAAVLAARSARIPRVIMVLNNFAEGYDRLGRWFEYGLDRAVAAGTELFVAGSQMSVTRIHEVLNLREGHVRAIVNGADLRSPSETVEQTRERLGLAGYTGVVFGVVALMEPRKGHRVLIDALHRLVTAHHLGPEHVRLIFVGDGMLRTELVRLVGERGLSQHCRFLGQESNGMNVISALDVLVLPSIANEDFPNVVLEAMGARKPVVASRIAGTPEQIVDGRTGLLVPPGDADALSQAMNALWRDASLRASMGDAGWLRYEERFTARASVERYIDTYRALLAMGDGASTDVRPAIALVMNR